ncbi:MAG: hypothetical protein ACTHLY_19645 [Pseudolabrys sp.]
MFPTLRLLLAGVSALFLVTLGALSLTSTSPPGVSARVVTAAFALRGPLISADDHPEWRPFLVQAASRRANELAKLRDLPERDAPNGPYLRWVSLPATPQDHAPAEAVETLNDIPSATLPMDIGEASSTELPVGPVEETAPPPVPLRALQSAIDALPPVGPEETVQAADDVTGSVPAALHKPVMLPRARTGMTTAAPKRVQKPRRKVMRRARAAAVAPAQPQTTNSLGTLFGQSQAPAVTPR